MCLRVIGVRCAVQCRVLVVRKRLLTVLAIAAAFVAPALGATPASAHTDLLQASPGPGQRVGGDVDFVDLVFLEPVSGATVEVSLDGAILDGSMVVAEGSIIRYELAEPLSSPGRYEVAYRMRSFDGDQTEETFPFTFEPDAPQALRIGDPVTGEVPNGGGRNWVQLLATAVLIASVAGLAFLFLTRLERRRRLAADATAPDEAQPDR